VCRFHTKPESGLRPRRFIAVEWHPGELYRRVDFIVTISRPTKRVVALYDKRETYTQWIKKDKDAFKGEYLFASFPTTNALAPSPMSPAALIRSTVPRTWPSRLFAPA
jgi:hypothetical protein